MSIKDYIQAKVVTGQLFYVPPNPGGKMVRRIIVPPEIHQEVFGGAPSWSNPKWVTRAHGLQSELAHFVDGYEIKVTFPNPAKPFASKPDAIMRQLYPGEEEVWEFRATWKPQVRLFGRVAAKDWFVALKLDDRANLPPGPWKAEIDYCKAEWAKHLPTFNPVSGTIDAYFSNATPL